MKVRATIRLTVQVTSKDVWSEDVTAAQVFNQAGKETVRDLQQALETLNTRIAIVEKPVVTMVLVEQEHV